MSVTSLEEAKWDRKREALENAVVKATMDLFGFMSEGLPPSGFALPLTPDKKLYVMAGPPAVIKSLVGSV